jgi:hypothetical protein
MQLIFKCGGVTGLRSGSLDNHARPPVHILTAFFGLIFTVY